MRRLYGGSGGSGGGGGDGIINNENYVQNLYRRLHKYVFDVYRLDLSTVLLRTSLGILFVVVGMYFGATYVIQRQEESAAGGPGAVENSASLVTATLYFFDAADEMPYISNVRAAWRLFVARSCTSSTDGGKSGLYRASSVSGAPVVQCVHMTHMNTEVQRMLVQYDVNRLPAIILAKGNASNYHYFYFMGMAVTDTAIKDFVDKSMRS